MSSKTSEFQRSIYGDHGDIVGRTPYIHGILSVNGFFLLQRWRRLNVELKNNILTFSILRGGVVKRTFHLDSKTVCEDNSARHFCFCLYKPDGERIVLAADNMASKESWTEAIQSSLSILRISGRKLKVDDRMRVMNQYINRPVMYIKVIRARNLLPKDVNGTSDPYAKISMGASTVRTTTRKKDLNPEWGMIFSFDWDLSLRFASVEVWDEDFSSTDDFLGQVIIPLLPMRYLGEEPITQWFPLTRRSSRSEFSGSIQLEISMSSMAPIPDAVVLYDFLKEVTTMDDFAINILPSDDGLGVIPLKRNGKLLLGNAQEAGQQDDAECMNAEACAPSTDIEDGEEATNALLYKHRVFPNSFPSMQNEQFEDIAFHVVLMQTLNNRKVSCPGAMLFTNYRLLFVTHARIFASPEPGAEGEDDPGFPVVDLSTQIFVGQVVSVHLTSEHDGGNSCESLKIRTTDHRQLLFLFKDDGANINENTYFNSYLNKFNQRVSKLLGARKRSVLRDGSQKLMAAAYSVTSSIPDDCSMSDTHSVDSTTSQRKMSILNYTNALANPRPSSPVNGASANVSTTAPSAAVLGINLEDEKLSGVTAAWLKMLTSASVSLIEALDSVEGPPAHRIYFRLKNRCANRPVERYLGTMQHHQALNALREACGLMTYAVPEYMDERPPLPGVYEVALEEPPRERGESTDPRLMSTDNALSMNPMTTSKGSRQSPAHLIATLADEEDPELAHARNQSTSHLAFAQNNTPRCAEGGASQLTEAVRDQTPAAAGLLQAREPMLSSAAALATANPDFKQFITKFFFNLETAWHHYDPLVELRRLNIPNKHWRISYLNHGYQLCPTYPNILCVPMTVTDDDLVLAAKFRSKHRLPVLSWRSPKGVPICRCSQPMVGISNNRNVFDEQLVNEVRRSAVASLSAAGISLSSSSKKPTLSVDGSDATLPLVIIDARPLLNAKANQAVGKGVESEKNYTNIQILFMDIPNIHAVRKAYDQLEETIYADELNYSKNVEGTLWLNYARKVLTGAMKIVYLVNRLHVPVLIHCSDGWDRTAQLTSLAMLLSDPYYRTLRGFIVLIEKEWLSFGHKFADRLGYTFDNYKDEERSPIFVQFLDCVYQVLAQLPGAFEFTAGMLLFIKQHLYSSLFATFLFNSEYEKKFFNAECHAVSIWTAVLANAASFLNPRFSPVEGYIVPIVGRTKLCVWQEAYFYWHDRLYVYQFQQFNELNGTASSAMANINQLLYGASNQFSAPNKPVAWVEDKHALACMKCEKAFHVLRRRHHCRCCGLVYCDPCSRELRLIPAISTWKLSRCCADCAQALDLALVEAEMSQKKLSVSYRKSLEVPPHFRRSGHQSQRL